MKLLLIICLSLPVLVTAQTGITGSALYAFAENAPGKADPGTKVYVFRYEGAGMPVYDTINKFITAKIYRAMNANLGRTIAIYTDSASPFKGRRKYEKEYNAYQSRIAGAKADADARNMLLQGMGADTKQKFDSLDYRASKAVSKVRFQMGSMQTVADASGIYTVKLTPGKYVILGMSNNKTGFTSSEVYGRLAMKQVEVKEGELQKTDLKFILD